MVTTEQLRLLPLAYYGDPILRRKADPITEITDDIKRLVEEMIQTMDAADGIGLAAPQVHHSIRLFILRTPIPGPDDTYERGDVKVFINPKISSPNQFLADGNEGCLSIPGIRGDVLRPTEITVTYTNLEGKLEERKFTDWEARVIMHENDHINGVLFIDRMDKKERARLEPLLQNMKKRIHDGREL